jgi:transcriptional regulator with XRE-family HTH domain
VNTWITDIRARQTAGREAVIIRLSRLGWTQEKISDQVGLSRNRVSEIVGNAIYGNIDTLLKQGRDMAYIASHYHMDLALAWALRLTSTQVQRMQTKRILGTIGRTLLIARRT